MLTVAVLDSATWAANAVLNPVRALARLPVDAMFNCVNFDGVGITNYVFNTKDSEKNDKI